MIKKQYPSNRYLVFACDGFYPQGGFSDLKFGFDTPKDFRDRFNATLKTNKKSWKDNGQLGDSYEIVDTQERTVLRFPEHSDIMKYMESEYEKWKISIREAKLAKLNKQEVQNER